MTDDLANLLTEMQQPACNIRHSVAIFGCSWCQYGVSGEHYPHCSVWKLLTILAKAPT